MRVEEAIASAKSFFEQVFAEEQISQVRLEEVEYDELDHAWLVTVSAVQPSSFADRWGALAAQSGGQRMYKSVKIDDSGARLPSVKIRQIYGERPDKIFLLDANLLVLLVVGATSRSLVAKHKKTKTFTVADYDRLVAMLGDHRIVVLPHIAAEASNLIGFHQEPERGRLLTVFKTIVETIDEEYVASRHAAQQREYRIVGLTDAAILATTTGAEILTADAVLHASALKRGPAVVNFNHLR